MKLEWLSESKTVFEFTLTHDALFLALMPRFSSAGLKSFGLLLKGSDLDQISKSPHLLTQLIKEKLTEKHPSYEIRLFGSQSSITMISAGLIESTPAQGKHIAFENGETNLVFLPIEGKVRREIKNVPEKRKKKVLVVDDSETIRRLLSKIISEDPEMECVATVEKPSDVEKAISEHKPDLITLDIHMPEMDGVTLLKKLMKNFDIPAVMISSLSKEEGTYVLDALEAGAIDYIQKPSMSELALVAPQIREKLKNAIMAKVIHANRSNTKKLVSRTTNIDEQYLICIGSSTGGTEALKAVLTCLPKNIPPILIVQHIPAVFSKAFADRMNSLCPFEVKEAQDGDLVKPGRVLIAPGGFQMSVRTVGPDLKVVIEDAPPMNRHKPSVDFLFYSVAKLKRKKLVAAILTGMGADGAKGLLELKNGGAYTFAQDEASCVVYGMPREAHRLGAASKMVSLDLIPEELVSAVSQTLRKVG